MYIHITTQSTNNTLNSDQKKNGNNDTLSHYMIYLTDFVFHFVDKEEWRDSLLSFSEEIVGEVDPRQLCPVLKEKGLINKRENADLTSSDSIDITWLTKQARVLHNVPEFVECLQWAGYTQLADDIRAEKGTHYYRKAASNWLFCE